MHTNDTLTGRRLCECADLETHFTQLHLNCLRSTAQWVLHTSTCAWERVTFSDMHALTLLFFLHAYAGEHKNVAFSTKLFHEIFHFSVFLCNCSSKPSHFMHGITLLGKLYQHIYAVSSQHLPYLTWTKSTKLEFPPRVKASRSTTHVYVRCMRAGTLLITTTPRERVVSCQ